MKKLLSILLTAPLLVTSCGSGEKEVIELEEFNDFYTSTSGRENLLFSSITIIWNEPTLDLFNIISIPKDESWPNLRATDSQGYELVIGYDNICNIGESCIYYRSLARFKFEGINIHDSIVGTFTLEDWIKTHISAFELRAIVHV